MRPELKEPSEGTYKYTWDKVSRLKPYSHAYGIAADVTVNWQCCYVVMQFISLL